MWSTCSDQILCFISKGNEALINVINLIWHQHTDIAIFITGLDGRLKISAQDFIVFFEMFNHIYNSTFGVFCSLKNIYKKFNKYYTFMSV